MLLRPDCRPPLCCRRHAARCFRLHPAPKVAYKNFKLCLMWTAGPAGLVADEAKENASTLEDCKRQSREEGLLTALMTS